MSDDVLITPASRKIEFKDNAGNVDGKIELDGNGNSISPRRYTFVLVI